MNIKTFLKQTLESGDFVEVQVRDRRLADSYPTTKVTELRTKKNTHKAMTWDELGNATVLTGAGEVRQLIGGEG